MSNWMLLVNFTLKSTLILVAAWVLVQALRRQSAATRHIVWTSAWAALLALPLISIALPAWPARLANAVLPIDSGARFETGAIASSASHGSIHRLSRPKATSAPPLGSADVDFRHKLTFLWLAGACFALIQMLAAYLAIWRLRRAARPSSVHIADTVPIFETEAGIPMTAGILRPAIFLPAGSGGWTPDRLRMVLAHERAHVARGDAATQLLARTALCLVWFHPLAWIAWREFLKERERATDDLVLGEGALASDYAGHLLEVARTLQPGQMRASAGVAMARRSQLESRLLAILDPQLKRRQPRRAALVLSVLAAMALVAPLATVRAQSPAEREALPNLDAAIGLAYAQKNYQVLDQVAAAYEKARRYDDAQTALETALAIRKESGTNSPVYAEGLVKLGQLALKRNKPAEATEYDSEAAAVGDMPETVPALIHLGLAANAQHDIAKTKDYLQRARNAAKTGNDIGRVMTWLAVVDEVDPSGAAEAESLLRTAMATEEIDSGDRALTMEVMAGFLRDQKRVGEAESLEAQARTIRRSRAAALSVHSTLSASQVSKVGHGTTAPMVILKVEPAYSEAARALKIQGTVLLKTTIDVDGLAKDIEVVRPLGFDLDEQAIEAVSQWKFKPGMLNGTPVPVAAQIEVNFRLL